MHPRRIAVFGSSTIYGTADTEMGGFVNRLKLWHEANDEKNRVFGLGIWGERTPELLERIVPEARTRKPHLLLIYPGYNDCHRRDAPDGPIATSPEVFADLMRELLTKAQSVAPAVVMTAYPFDESRTRPYRYTNAYYCLDDARRYMAILVEVAESLGVKVLDFFGMFRETDMTPLLSSDGLHGNAACHQRLFELTKRFLVDECGARG
ncbi:GDSL-like Lipase/Acylhydrolase [Planctomycetes bacterium Pan216]|uniref:GDSL-like Lipase/Acylhydrolase n=1 Tax=Kolteria novifilia TaxID=2527975 RepID=A0A518AXH6_9BACT|nr:GDSL-like Lipase/Acylhydrolase [Planctomycetes bacterium Pan216]